MTDAATDLRQLAATRRLIAHIAERLDGGIAVRLWNGEVIPLGPRADLGYQVIITSAAVLGSLLRRPTLENLMLHYAEGLIALEGGDLITFVEAARRGGTRLKLRDLDKRLLLGCLWTLIRAPSTGIGRRHAFDRDETGRSGPRFERDYIQFHYDIGDDFYALFLDPAMQYSCAYFTDFTNDIATAQTDKLDLICRKLRLRPGDRLLDIGCGWAGLVCHAALQYGVTAHGVTLSQSQHDFAQAKIAALGLQDRVRVELKDYRMVEGQYGKIASIGMYEHVGIANYPTYFAKLKSLLRPGGVLLNHGITRRAKADPKRFRRIRPENRLILKYVFPGSELDHVGHSVAAMEAAGFEVHDVEGLREHYAQTTRLWCQRLSARRDEAVALVGEARYRLWVGYLAGVSFAFQSGALRLFQTVATHHVKYRATELPPTRADLYRG